MAELVVDNRGVVPFIQSIGEVHKGVGIMQTLHRKAMQGIGLMASPLIMLNSVVNSESLTGKLVLNNVAALQDEWKTVRKKNNLVHSSVHIALAFLGGAAMNTPALALSIPHDAIGLGNV